MFCTQRILSNYFNVMQTSTPPESFLDTIQAGDASKLISLLPSASIDLSFWSPPYHVGKNYELGATFEEWQELIKAVLQDHARVLKPGAFVAVNINDILCFQDPAIPQFQADLTDKKKIKITREQILAVKSEHPNASRYELARLCGCSEQTIQRRLEHNNVRGGKKATMTKVMLVGGLLQRWAEEAGLYLYDRRIWAKDPCWENSKWHSSSYRAVDEFEYVYIFWKPGITHVRRGRLSKEEWAEWGSRGVWFIPSVRANVRHEAEFPEALADRVIRLLSSPGDTVLDPFCGSGTTCVVAKRLGRHWVGFDLSEDYCNLTRSRLNE